MKIFCYIVTNGRVKKVGVKDLNVIRRKFPWVKTIAIAVVGNLATSFVREKEREIISLAREMVEKRNGGGETT